MTEHDPKEEYRTISLEEFAHMVKRQNAFKRYLRSLGTFIFSESAKYFFALLLVALTAFMCSDAIEGIM